MTKLPCLPHNAVKRTIIFKSVIAKLHEAKMEFYMFMNVRKASRSLKLHNRCVLENYNICVNLYCEKLHQKVNGVVNGHQREKLQQLKHVSYNAFESEMVLPAVHESEMVLPAVHESEMVLPAVHESEMVLPAVRESEMVLPAVNESEMVLPAVHESEMVLPAVHESEMVLPAVHES